MTEREYVKVNTSILTGSNAAQLKSDPEGNVEAVVELRLPDNLFDSNSDTRQITSVDLKTSKLRLSLANTPIAKIPLDMSLTDRQKDFIATQMQLDVYPYCLLDNGGLFPEPGRNDIFAMKHYKKLITVRVVDDTTNNVVLSWTGYENDIYSLPSDDVILTLLARYDVDISHCMNVCVQSNHEPYQAVDDKLYVRNIGTLEQMLQDALENAITYAFTESVRFFLFTVYQDPLGDVVIGDNRYSLINMYEYTHNLGELLAACKPKVSIGAQSISISYDTAPFGSNVPVLWNPGFVNTADAPEQLTIDTARKGVWMQPPPKRPYTNPVQRNSDNTWGYQVPSSKQLCSPMNLVVNKAMRDVFSFMPWIPFSPPVDTDRPSVTLGGAFRLPVLGTRSSHTGAWVFDQSANPNISVYEIPEPGLVDEDGRRYIEYHFHYSTNTGISTAANRTDQWIDCGDMSIDGVPLSRLATNNLYTCSSSNNITVASYNARGTPYLFATGHAYATNNITNLTSYTTTGPAVFTDATISSTGSSREVVIGDTAPYYYIYESNGQLFGAYPFDGIGTWRENQTTYCLPSLMQGDYVPVSITAADSGYDYSCRFYIDKAYRVAPSQTFTMYNRTFNGVRVIGQFQYTAPFEYSPPSLTSNILDTDLYILDGTPAEVSISSSELVATNTATYKMYKSVERTDSIYIGWISILQPQYTITPPVVTVNSSNRYSWGAISGHALRSPSQQLLELRYDFPSTFDISQMFYGPAPTLIAPLVSVIGAIRVTLLNAEDVSLVVDESEAITYQGGSTSMSATAKRSHNNRFITTESVEYYYGDRPAIPASTTSIVMTREAKGWGEDSYYTFFHSCYTYNRITQQPVPSGDGDMANAPPQSFTPDSFCCFIPHAFDEEDWNTYWEQVPASEPGVQSWVIRIVVGPSHKMYSLGGFYIPEKLSHELYRDYRIYKEGLPITELKQTTTTGYGLEGPLEPSWLGNKRLTFTWNDLPMVVLSPIQSIVLTLEGIQVSTEYQPVNMTLPTGSSLTSTLPVVENYYSLASTLRDLHDELVVAKDDFDDTAKYKVALQAGKERTIRLAAKYIDKDGTLQQIYIPANGVFSIQLTFGISYYSVRSNIY